MRLIVVGVLLVGIAVPVVAAPAAFTETNPVDTATPSSLSDDFRVTIPYDDTTEVRELRDSDVNLSISVVTTNATEKTYYINLEESQVYQEGIQYRTQVNNTDVNTTIEENLGQEWLVFTTSEQNFTVTIQPQGVSESTGFIGQLSRLLFSSPVTILILGGVIVLVSFGAYQVYTDENEKLYVN